MQHSESTRHLSPPFTRSATTTTPGALYRLKGAPASDARLATRPPFAHSSVFRPPSSPRVSLPMAVRYQLLTHGEPCIFIRCVTDDKYVGFTVARSTHENGRAGRRFPRRPTGRKRKSSGGLARGGNHDDDDDDENGKSIHKIITKTWKSRSIQTRTTKREVTNRTSRERRVSSTHSLVNHLSGVERDDTSRSVRNKLYICTTFTWQLTGV